MEAAGVIAVPPLLDLQDLRATTRKSRPFLIPSELVFRLNFRSLFITFFSPDFCAVSVNTLDCIRHISSASFVNIDLSEWRSEFKTTTGTSYVTRIFFFVERVVQVCITINNFLFIYTILELVIYVQLYLSLLECNSILKYYLIF